jgi:hypothetical protein
LFFSLADVIPGERRHSPEMTGQDRRPGAERSQEHSSIH